MKLRVCKVNLVGHEKIQVCSLFCQDKRIVYTRGRVLAWNARIKAVESRELTDRRSWRTQKKDSAGDFDSAEENIGLSPIKFNRPLFLPDDWQPVRVSNDTIKS